MSNLLFVDSQVSNLLTLNNPLLTIPLGRDYSSPQIMLHMMPQPIGQIFQVMKEVMATD